MSLPAPQVDALMQAQHGDPFAVLGMHQADDGALWVRALLPDASTVELLDALSDKRICTLRLRHDEGLFEARIPRRRKRFDYRFAVRWRDGQQQLQADAFAFGPQLADEDLQALHQGRHPQPGALLGAHQITVAGVDGVRFALWAPEASRVSVVGDFNHWDGRRHPMRPRHQVGVWETFVPGVDAGALYKFELLDHSGRLLPLKADPYARASELRPHTASRVANWPEQRELPHDRAARNRRDAPISIYEVHAPSWRESAAEFPSWDELAESLPAYVRSLGFTHIELMPISEHPFDGSWGYQTLGLYATSARFGEPAGFGRFVDACHQQGLGLLLDWVPAHFPEDGHGLARFDGSHLYEYADPREGFHRDWNTLIYNFGRTEVRSFLSGSALYWLQQHAVDGLRVDAVASMLYRDYSRPDGEWIPNAEGGRENLEAISLLRQINERVGAECPGAITVAEESTAFAGVSAPVSSGGLGFHYKWNMGWMNDTLRYMREDPVHRRWHHEKLSFGLVYAFSENFILPISHDEVVHGKRSLLGKMPGDEWQRFANARAFLAYMWTHPGKKLLFMGSDVGQYEEWNESSSVGWELLQWDYHRGLQATIRRLNEIYRHEPALHQVEFHHSGFEWIDINDVESSVISFLRHAENRQDYLVVVCNFTPAVRQGYRIGVPDGGFYAEILNTDSREFGGSGVTNGEYLEAQHQPCHGRPFSLSLTLPPLGVTVLKRRG